MFRETSDIIQNHTEIRNYFVMNTKNYAFVLYHKDEGKWYDRTLSPINLKL